jgi:hypothetical protein
MACVNRLRIVAGASEVFVDETPFELGERLVEWVRV